MLLSRGFLSMCDAWKSRNSFTLQVCIPIGAVGSFYIRPGIICSSSVWFQSPYPLSSSTASELGKPICNHEIESCRKSKRLNITKPGSAEEEQPMTLQEIFRDAILLRGNNGESKLPSGTEVQENESIGNSEGREIGVLKRRMLELENEVRFLKESSISKQNQKCLGRTKAAVRLSSLFKDPEKMLAKSVEQKNNSSPEKALVQPRERMDDILHSSEGDKEEAGQEDIPPEMISFANALYKEGYLGRLKVLQDGQLNFRLFSTSSYHHFLLSAASKFGEAHQEIAKWISGSELKKIALLGCPCTERKTVFAAKNLRSFFSIQEVNVCRGCQLRSSCKFVNETVSKNEKLILSEALRVLTAYGFGSAPKHLSFSNRRKASVKKLLKEVVDLTH